jgi:hypothetical protein
MSKLNRPRYITLHYYIQEIALADLDEIDKGHVWMGVLVLV